MKQFILSSFFALLLFSNTTYVQSQNKPNLIPEEICTAPNYWCTWYWQNYMIEAGKPIITLAGEGKFSNQAAREAMNYENLFGEKGWAKTMLPHSRGEYYFVIDHGWQDKSIKKKTFFSLIMDNNDFPEFAKLEPKERIKKLNEEFRALGWRGLGLWVRGNVTEVEARQFVEWSKYAGVEYWKIDGGDITNFWSTKAKMELYPELVLEHVTGAGGPLNLNWDKSNLDKYQSVYEQGTLHVKDSHAGSGKASQALEVIKNTDVFRTYDAVPLLVSTVTLQRIHDILVQTAGNDEYSALLNIQDDCNIAAALGCVVAVKRHPMETPRMYKGRDIHFQIAGDRHVDKRFNEMDRLVRWQRIAPPMSAGYGTYSFSDENLIAQFIFRAGDTWKQATWDKMVTQGAPAIMARDLPLPEVNCDGEAPYVLASKFPNGAIAIATEGRVKPDNSWFHPRADVTVKVGKGKAPIGIFGHYKTLRLKLAKPFNNKSIIWAQDLLSNEAVDITNQVKKKGDLLIISGKTIDKIGTMAGDAGDISVPGLVISIQ